MFTRHSHPCYVGKDGVRIRALSGGTFENEKSEIFILRSEDDGATWEFVRLQPGGPGEIGFTEPAIVETADHRLLAMMRSVPEGYLWQSFSDDFGKTWTEPESSGMIGHPAHLLALPDGRLLCTYGYRRHPMGVRASISNDNGKTWEVGSEFVLRADGKHKPADQGYPTTVLLDDGSLFTIYYITLADNNTHIAATNGSGLTSIGSLELVDTNLNLLFNDTLAFDLGGSVGSGLFDTLTLTLATAGSGAIMYLGTTATLNIQLVNGVTPVGGTYQIIMADSVVSTFDTLLFNGAANSGQYTVNYLNNGVEITMIPEPSAAVLLLGGIATGLLVFRRRRTV